MDLSLVIPCYNDIAQIPSVVSSASEILVASGLKYEIMVVDDGSSPPLSLAAQHSGIHIMRHPYNKGYGAALKTGAIAAKGEYLLYMDGDGQHAPADIALFLSSLGTYDMIVGARSRQASALRGLGKVFLHHFAHYLLERPIPDLNSGFRLIRRNLVIKYMHLLPDTFSFTTTITMALFKAGYTVTYVPITIRERKSGKSSIRPFRDGFRFVMLMIRMTMLFNPLKVFLPASMLLFAIGIPLLLYRIISSLQTSESALLLVIAGMLTFLFGLVADQIALLVRK
ncbi:TPA: glycosyltransferase family 2 protein [Candidatus Woesearchaeota archaeon]|nr:glycosyltransferase family 2 protein [Candidatus Woesearchaeota archaeon]HII68369.1 glycosyltransferase family 2 protein [Candidatus Woesearchaeota archaeon]